MISRLSPESFSPFTTPMARWEATVLQTRTAPSGTLPALSTALPNHNYFAHISLQAFFFSTFAPFLCVFHPQGGREPHPPTLLPPLGTSSHYHASPSTHSPHQPSARPPPPALPPPHPAALGACPFPSARSAAMYSRHVPRLAARSGGGEKPWWLQPGDRRGAAAGSSTRTARPPRYSAKRKGAGEAPLRQSPPLPSALPRRDAGGSAPLLRAGHPP